MAYTKDRRINKTPPIRNSSNTLETLFQGKSRAFRQALFPPPPPPIVSITPSQEYSNQDYSNSHRDSIWQWPSLSFIELEKACSTAKKGKTPGPDNEIAHIKGVHHL